MHRHTAASLANSDSINPPTNPSTNTAFAEVLQRRLQRRQFLQATGLAATLPLWGCGGDTPEPSSTTRSAAPVTAPASSTLSFTELEHALDEQFTVAPGYRHQVLIRWGDPLFADAPAFDPANQSKAAQERQFGFNNDFVGFVPLPLGSTSSSSGLLVVNHEYSDTQLMFPGAPDGVTLDQALTDVDIASLGLSIVEIRRSGEQWSVVLESPYNRRITPLTPLQFDGPAAGSARLHTLDSADGIKTWGTYGNCAGGVTPWGTILTGEENVDFYFNGDATITDEAEHYSRFGVGGMNRKSWGTYYPRWNLDRNPHELLHVGWIVEIDPYDPSSVPKKRTTLGRCKHEGCNVFVNLDGRVAAYTGDDQQFEYLYKFISDGRYDPANRAANLDLLGAGTLYAARFDEDGTLVWLPLIHGIGPLTEANGFASQADVLIDSRKAADLLGATKMDRPEDVEVNPVNGRVYVMLTNNARRSAEQVDATNPRAENRDGQIVEFWPEDGNHASDTFRWELFLVAGNPAESTGTTYHPQTSSNGWLSCPDNCAFDNLGNLWIATDGAEGRGVAEGVWATEVKGEFRALTKRFLRSPVGSELCGPFFTPDCENLFCSVQHPAEGSSWDMPATRWPDFDPALPPRPAVVVVTKEGGGRIGS